MAKIANIVVNLCHLQICCTQILLSQAISYQRPNVTTKNRLSPVPSCNILLLTECLNTALHSAMVIQKRDFQVQKFVRTTPGSNFEQCSNSRKFLTCFSLGCSPTATAKVAAAVFEKNAGKNLPFHIFLAYRGHLMDACKCGNALRPECSGKMSGIGQDIDQGWSIFKHCHYFECVLHLIRSKLLEEVFVVFVPWRDSAVGGSLLSCAMHADFRFDLLTVCLQIK